MGAPNLTFEVPDNLKISTVAGNNGVTVSFTSDKAYTKFECRATKVGEDYGYDKGELIAQFLETPADTVRQFEVSSNYLQSGDGEYRISLYAFGEDGNVNDNEPYTMSNGETYETEDGKVYLSRR